MNNYDLLLLSLFSVVGALECCKGIAHEKDEEGRKGMKRKRKRKRKKASGRVMVK